MASVAHIYLQPGEHNPQPLQYISMPPYHPLLGYGCGLGNGLTDLIPVPLGPALELPVQPGEEHLLSSGVQALSVIQHCETLNAHCDRYIRGDPVLAKTLPRPVTEAADNATVATNGLPPGATRPAVAAVPYRPSTFQAAMVLSVVHCQPLCVSLLGRGSAASRSRNGAFRFGRPPAQSSFPIAYGWSSHVLSLFIVPRVPPSAVSVARRGLTTSPPADPYPERYGLPTGAQVVAVHGALSSDGRGDPKTNFYTYIAVKSPSSTI
ncbi:hypothetical protein ACFLWG_03580 [Chloroflexota bacterium]